MNPAPVRSLVTAFIENAFLPSGPGIALPVVNPATAEQVSEVEETGPMVDDLDEAFAIANGTRFGLVSYPWTEHLPISLTQLGLG